MASQDQNNTPDWQVGLPLAECLWNMLYHEIACDVVFEVHDGDRPVIEVSAHKTILRARSPVFEAMFSGNFAETDENVIIPDIGVAAFQQILQYIYTDQVRIVSSIVVQILYGAEKYILPGLKNNCQQFLDKKMSPQNVCIILVQSLKYKIDDVTQQCLEYMATRISSVSKTKGFYEMSQDDLLTVVKYDMLDQDGEADLFAGCLEWAKGRLQEGTRTIRSVLGPCLLEIRFPFIPAETFAEQFGHTEALSDTEKTHVLCFGLTNCASNRSSLFDKGFNVSSRTLRIWRSKVKKEARSSFNRRIKVKQEAREVSETFTIWFDKPVVLKGFIMYGGTGDKKQDIPLTLYPNTTAQAEGGTVDHIIRVAEGDTLTQVFTADTPLLANTEYTVHVTIPEGREHDCYPYNAAEGSVAGVRYKLGRSECTSPNDRSGFMIIQGLLIKVP